MSFRQQLILALAAPLTLTVVVAAAFLALQPAPPAPALAALPGRFDPARAQARAAALDALAPVRPVGAPGNEAARQWLAAEFAALGLTPSELSFNVTVASQERVGVQVWATRPGTLTEALLIVAHYDTPDDGGRANTAGLAALVELAEVFSTEAPRHTLIFMASDAREYGRAWGMKTWLERSGLRARVTAALTLEAGAPGPEVALRAAGLHTGYAPLWLRQTTQAAVAAAGGQAHDALAGEEFLARALPFEMSDASLLLRAGVPAVELAAAPDQLPVVGAAAEQWVRAVDVRPAGPPDDVWAWRVTEAHTLPGLAVYGLSLLLFAPLFVALGLEWAARRPHRAELLPEALSVVGTALPMINGLAVLFILVRLGLLPDYEWYPAAPGEAFLRQPADWALVAMLAVAALSAWDVWGRARGWGRLADRLTLPTRRLTLLALLSLTVVGVWAVNPLGAVLMLGPAAYLWPWLGARARGEAAQPWAGGLVLGGLAPWLGVAVALFLAPEPGVWSWYLLMGAVYGLFPLPLTLAVLLALTIGLRFIRLHWRQA